METDKTTIELCIATLIFSSFLHGFQSMENDPHSRF